MTSNSIIRNATNMMPAAADVKVLCRTLRWVKVEGDFSNRSWVSNEVTRDDGKVFKLNLRLRASNDTTSINRVRQPSKTQQARWIEVRFEADGKPWGTERLMFRTKSGEDENTNSLLSEHEKKISALIAIWGITAGSFDFTYHY